MPYSHDQIRSILATATEKHILPYFRNLTEDQIDTKSGDYDFVTIADRETEKYLTGILQDFIPGSMVLGEEAYAEDEKIIERCADMDDVWIVDPVDGTGNFKKGDEKFCTLLAHVHKGVLVGAWIYAHFLGKFVAWKRGDPVTINGQTVALDKTEKPLDQMIIGDHVSYGQKQDSEKLHENRRFFARRESVYSFGIETLYMIENKIDWLSFSWCNPWDIAPCAAMIPALGGAALKVDGSAMTGRNLFDRKGAFLAVRTPGQWTDIRDAMLHEIDWKKFFV